MAQRFSQQSHAAHAHPSWEVDVKDECNDGTSQHVGEHNYHEPLPHTMADDSLNRSHSMVKLEEDFQAGEMWHDRPHSPSFHLRHYPTANIATVGAHPQHMQRMYSQSYSISQYGAQAPWPMPSASGSSTPTPLYGPVGDHVPVHFNSTTGVFPFQLNQQRSVAMSPQSSQGGWASARSDDSGGVHEDADGPKFRPMSPMTVQRSDGMRKKNARFDIPNHVTLATVEDLIKAATDEGMKKELKQQKRLLRNRQAALDSRSRKREDMEKLNAEKKFWTSEKQDLMEDNERLKNTLEYEREQVVQMRQHYENFIQTLQYERDEAIRSKTIETAEVRRQNNVLKDCVRDLERHQADPSYLAPSSISETYNDFPSFDSLDLGNDGWEDEFSLIHSDDLKMGGEDSPQRQLTPRPLPIPRPSQDSPTSLSTVSKTDTGFSWSTFSMCLLFGAFIASQPKSAPTHSTTSTSTANHGGLPPLSDQHRTEANNVLKAVLASDVDVTGGLVHPSQLASALAPGSKLRTQLSNSGLQPSSLDVLSTHLTTPTRQQQVAAAFALTPSQYEHIVNPEGLPMHDVNTLKGHGGSSTPAATPKAPSLQAMFASMQAERDEIERAVGLGSKSRERSLILDRVPEEVLQDFRRLVAEREGRTGGD